MKKLFLFALLILAVIGLPVAANCAQPELPQSSLDPGCSPDMWKYMTDQADATRARNKAYEREILNRQQSTLYLTCFDQAMAVSAKLGLMFSDDVFPAPPPANALVTTGSGGTISYPDWGASQPTLAMDLDGHSMTHVPGLGVNGMFDNWLSDKAINPNAPALFNFLPEWLPANNHLTALADVQRGLLAPIMALLGADASLVAQYNTEVMGITALVNSMPMSMLQDLQLLNMAYYEGPPPSPPAPNLTALAETLAAIQGERAGMMPLIQALAAAFSTVKNTCNEDRLWTQMDPGYPMTNPRVAQDPGAFYPPEGNYYPFSPYYTLKDFIMIQAPLEHMPPPPPAAPQTAVTNPPPPYTLDTPPYPQSPPYAQTPMPDFIQELGDVTDNNALQQALNDIGNTESDINDIPNNKAPIGYIGNNPSLWPAPPTFFDPEKGTVQPLSAQDVINQM